MPSSGLSWERISYPLGSLFISLKLGFREPVFLISRYKLRLLLVAAAFSVSLHFFIHHCLRPFFRPLDSWHLEDLCVSFHVASGVTHLWEANRPTEVGNTYRFWGLHDLVSCLTVVPLPHVPNQRFFDLLQRSLGPWAVCFEDNRTVNCDWH